MASLDRAARIAQTLVLWTVVAIFACAAAVVAHVAIDGIANVVLAHDPFDDVAHSSRSVVTIGVLAMLVTVLSVTMISGLADARARANTFARILARAASCSVWRFAVRIAPLTVALLLGMEAADSIAAGVRIDDAADLLGGSVPLGLVITLAIAVASAFGARHLLAALARAHRAVIAAVTQLIRVPVVRPQLAHLEINRDGIRSNACSVLARRAGKRAPPLLSIAIP